ncbi:hypothetical protein [Sediminibacterium sp.]|uniref:hypothetical protein n=1 Tax=Sediminibacterium sp. TaxID=1917865 RepID=UPI002734E020|nr:hypothetical protein [Sediminibacterium sp.]MDP3393643.1 hypothetical protein [Sediminibacterium sp.]MDP3566584.1 hypothetical protein [Sediminibacterium sp.]
MNLTDYQLHCPANFSNQSKVWIYQSNRLFSISEAFEIEAILSEFVSNWQSHGAPVKGFANLFFGQFIVLMADETNTTVGGCSTDSSVHVIKKIEQLFKVDLFNRQNLAFYIKEKVQLLPLAQINYAWENNFINGETIYFNNTVTTKERFLNDWLIPLKSSWLKSKIKALSFA